MLQIKKTTEKEKNFFKEMGLYFSRKEIIKEMDCQLYSNTNMIWYIGYEGQNIIGFVSVEEFERFYYVDNFYVIDKYRRKGYARKIFEKMFTETDGRNKKIKLITRNNYAKKIFEDFGMKEVSKKGRYGVYENNHKER